MKIYKSFSREVSSYLTNTQLKFLFYKNHPSPFNAHFQKLDKLALSMKLSILEPRPPNGRNKQWYKGWFIDSALI